MKRCPDCGVLKTEKEFGINRTRRDGLQGQCKKCRQGRNTRRTSERLRTDPPYRERRTKRMRGRSRNTPGRQAARERDKRERRVKGSPAWARHKVTLAVSRGTLAKPSTCERCGDRPPRYRLHGHHYHGDYANRPLDVEWLCSMCHSADHRFGEDAMSLYRKREDQPEPAEATA